MTHWYTTVHNPLSRSIHSHTAHCHTQSSHHTTQTARYTAHCHTQSSHHTTQTARYTAHCHTQSSHHTTQTARSHSTLSHAEQPPHYTNCTITQHTVTRRAATTLHKLHDHTAHCHTQSSHHTTQTARSHSQATEHTITQPGHRAHDQTARPQSTRSACALWPGCVIVCSVAWLCDRVLCGLAV